MPRWVGSQRGFKAFGSLLLGFPTRKIMLVNSRHGEHLPRAFDGLAPFLYDPQVQPPIWCVRFWVSRVFLNRHAPRELRSLIAIAKTIGARHLVATDALPELMALEKYLSDVKMYWIQHGLFLDQGTSILRREEPSASRTTSITLLAISKYDLSSYERWGTKPPTIIPVGSLKNGMFARRSSGISFEPPEPRFDICLVEKGFRVNPDSEYSQGYKENWDNFLPIFAQYLSLRRPRLIVAFSRNSERTLVANYFREKLKYDFVATDEKVDFATYYASDSAEVTLGIASTVLVESLSRRRKVLSFNCTPYSIWNFPGSRFIRLNSTPELTLNQLQVKVDDTLAMPWEEYARRISGTLDMFATDPIQTIPSIRSIVLGDDFVQRTPV